MYEGAEQANYPGMGAGQLATRAQVDERYQKLTVRDNIDAQIERAEKELERLKGIRDRIAPELLDQRIADLRQAMHF